MKLKVQPQLLFWISVLLISLITFTSLKSQAQMQTPQDEKANSADKKDWLRIIGYKNFGPRYYMASLKYPYLAPNFSYKPLTEFAIPLKQNAKPNEGADQSNWVALPVKGKAVYYRAEYHFREIEGMDVQKMFFEARDHYESTPSKKAHWDATVADKNSMVQFGKIQMVVFPAEQFRFKYYPGYFLLWKPNGMMNSPENLSAPRGGVQWKPEYNQVMPNEIPNLAGLLKGTYDNSDTIREGKLAGLIVDGKVVDQPLDYVQSVAIYKDGTLHIGPYSKLDRSQIQFLRQNELPMMVNGEINLAGSYLINFNRYADHILRTYLFASKDGKYIGYAWVNFAHPMFVSRLLQKLGFGELMALDIHSAVGAGLAMPSNNPAASFGAQGGSYAFIPLEQDVLTSTQQAIGQEANQDRPMQWGYQWPQIGMQNHDFFGVFVK